MKLMFCMFAEDIGLLKVRSNSGEMVPLSALVSTQWVAGPDLLPHFNGFPARLIVPGWTGTYWMKHLVSIQALSQPLKNFWMASAYRVPLGKFLHYLVTNPELSRVRGRAMLRQGHADQAHHRPEREEVGAEIAPPLAPLGEVGLARREDRADLIQQRHFDQQVASVHLHDAKLARVQRLQRRARAADPRAPAARSAESNPPPRAVR